jgi:hypothetical protein
LKSRNDISLVYGNYLYLYIRPFEDLFIKGTTNLSDTSN